MHPKTAANNVSPRASQIFSDNFFSVFKQHKLEDEQLKSGTSDRFYDEKNVTEDAWWEEEAIKREFPLTNQLRQELNVILTQRQDLLLSHCPDLTRRIAEEIARASREEPCGMTACRVYVKIAPNEDHVTADSAKNAKSTDQCATFSLGTVDLSNDRVVPTFEIYVYLFPSTSLLSRLQSIMTSLSPKKNVSGVWMRSRSISLIPDFIMVKRKLFRSRSNSVTIIRSMASK